MSAAGGHRHTILQYIIDMVNRMGTVGGVGASDGAACDGDHVLLLARQPGPGLLYGEQGRPSVRRTAE